MPRKSRTSSSQPRQSRSRAISEDFDDLLSHLVDRLQSTSLTTQESNPETLMQGVLACPAGALTMWNIICNFLDEVISCESTVQYLFATRSIFETVTQNNLSQDLQGILLLRERNHHEIDIAKDRYNLRCSIYLGNQIMLRSRDPNYKNPRSEECWE